MSKHIENKKTESEKLYLASINAEIKRRLQTRTFAEAEKELLSLSFFKNAKFSSVAVLTA